MEAGVLPIRNGGQKGLCAWDPHRALLGLPRCLLQRSRELEFFPLREFFKYNFETLFLKIWLLPAVYRTLVPQPGIEPIPPALEEGITGPPGEVSSLREFCKDRNKWESEGAVSVNTADELELLSQAVTVFAWLSKKQASLVAQMVKNPPAM